MLALDGLICRILSFYYIKITEELLEQYSKELRQQIQWRRMVLQLASQTRSQTPLVSMETAPLLFSRSKKLKIFPSPPGHVPARQQQLSACIPAYYAQVKVTSIMRPLHAATAAAAIVNCLFYFVHFPANPNKTNLRF